MFRASTTTLKFANTGKRDHLNRIRDEYKHVVGCFVAMFWNNRQTDKIPLLVGKKHTSQISSWLSAAAIQCAGKQASGMVRGTLKKHVARQRQIDKFFELNRTKEGNKLLSIHKQRLVSMPSTDNIDVELDSRMVKIEFDSTNSFDGWMTVHGVAKKTKIVIPFKRNRHLNGLMAQGGIRKFARISDKEVTFSIEIPDKISDKTGVLAIDIGSSALLSLAYNDGREEQHETNKQGWTLKKINERMVRCERATKGFRNCQKLRNDFISEMVKKIDWQSIGTLRIEKIRGLRYKRKTSKVLKHFTYPEVFERLRLTANQHGVRVEEVSPTYTSQRCSVCGWVCKKNRNLRKFKCVACGFDHDADLNAGRNILFRLVPITDQQRENQINRAGFYWNDFQDEPDSPSCPKASREATSVRTFIDPATS